MDPFSYLSNAESGYVERLYEQYRQAPEEISDEWRKFFDGFEFATKEYKQNGAAGPAVSQDQVTKEIQCLNMIAAYRSRGHLFADYNPLFPPDASKAISYKDFGLTDGDLDTQFMAATQVGRIGIGPASLRDIIGLLEQTYLGSIGVEYKHIREPESLRWLESRMEQIRNKPDFSGEEKKQILRKLGEATTFEAYLHRKFVGQKRFSLEGAEALIPALHASIERAAELGCVEFVLGMAHRGRLNVLVNIMRKEYDNVFREFTGKGLSDSNFDGDVKYHLGYSNDRVLANGDEVHLSLAPNPSHLEAVDPVVMGIARAKIEALYEGEHTKVCPILIHGDASLAGQGVTYEVQQMANVEGYRVGGAVHIVINNQIGFTTDPRQGRSSTYCTDVAKVTLSPVFHVNGNDAEALTYITKLAMDYRNTFQRDVYIDIVCYRKYGHNEGDEPRFTNPQLYSAIDKQKTPYKVYTEQLLNEGSIDKEYTAALDKDLQAYLDKELEESKVNTYELGAKPTRQWDGLEYYDDQELEENPDTRVAADKLKTLTEKFTTLPEDFTFHKFIHKLSKQRRDMIFEHDKIDWGMGETLAYAALLEEGYPVRISGQDCQRGTFSHRHAVIKDMEREAEYVPLNHLSDNQAQIAAYNSILSEFAVMGFEFGFSYANPRALTIWEAQYGDFCNGAQIIIDQFVTASKTKWQRMSGLTLLLPHGYEGGGPEHSSARMERFLILSAENNMYVCNLTTPANLFHALRRQLHGKTRRPLVIFSPKSLLRHTRCVSTLADFAENGFREVIDDAQAKVTKVKRVVLCTGKIYYDLLEKQQEHNLEEVAIVRVEQLYPVPQKQLDDLRKRYKKARSWVWVQEEPENMGAWAFVLRKFKGLNLEVVARKESASPATASASQHNRQQEEIVAKALELKTEAKAKEPVTA